MELNKYSKTITQDPTLPAAQAMLYGIGLTEHDLSLPQVGIVSTGFEGNTCNMHLNDLAKQVKAGVIANEMVGLVFHSIGVSDGISNGTTGMRYSLVSRDIIADGIETVMGAQWYDALVAVVGCDKNMPGAAIAMGRLNRPSILLYGGTIHSGNYKGQSLNIVSAFEALGQHINGELDETDFKNIVKNACPGAGACGGMYTANTMASAIEALGLSLPYSSSNPAISNEKLQECTQVAQYMKILLEKDIKPRDILTKKAFENAMTVVTALGGSTNAVLHLIAIAHSVGIELTLAHFQRITDRTPVLADLKPSGKYLMEDVHRIGGVPAVMKYLWNQGFLDGNCLTVTGQTLAENLALVPDLTCHQDVIRKVNDPVSPQGQIQCLFGTLAPEGSVAKISGKEGRFFEGKARVFDREEDLVEALQAKNIEKGSVIVIRYCGPKGGPGMPEMLKPTSLIMGSGLGKDVALVTDGRFSGGSHGFVIGHIAPEAYEGGPIALVQDGDNIQIDIENNSIDLFVDEKELLKRKANWSAPTDRPKQGVLYKYQQLVASASKGCVTDL